MNNITESKLPIGVSDFKKLALGNYHFVDKTLFIKDVMQDGADVILITRPRRFGKTLNLSMLHYFLQVNPEHKQDLFEGLSITTDKQFCEQYKQKYPVIFISFKDIRESSYNDAYGAIVELVAELYEEHRYLLEGDCLHKNAKRIFESLLDQKASRRNVISGIKKLSDYLAKKFNNPPVILIDEYDTPIQEAYLNGYYDKMIKLMRGILGRALKDNKNISKAVLTGIARIAQESLFSGVNNLAVYTLLKGKYGQYFGFVEGEVEKLITNTKLSVKLDIIREWYNGYKIGEYVIYNPWSIIACLYHNGELAAYWLNTTSNDLIRSLIANTSFKVRQYFELLLQGELIERPLMENLVFRDLEKREDAIWSLLLYAGYLNVLGSELQGFRVIAKLSVPNKEVMLVYDDIISGWFIRDTSVDFYDELIDGLAYAKLEQFKQSLASYLMESGSYFDFNKNTPEQVFHSFILGIIVGLKKDYIIKSNQESGLGRFDVVFLPKDNKKDGILLEFKVGDKDQLIQKAQEALQQIKDRLYFTTFKSHGVKFVLAIGMAFCGKQVELAHERLEIK